LPAAIPEMARRAFLFASGVSQKEGMGRERDLKIGDLVEGTVVETADRGAVVRWDTGEGFLPREEAGDELRVGQRLLLKVVASDGEGMPILSQLQVTEADRDLYELQREAERVRRFLREKRLSLPKSGGRPREVPVEERLARWISEAERALERLRRKRSRSGLRG